MTALTLLEAIDRPGLFDGDRDDGEEAVHHVGGAPTLDDVLTRAWQTVLDGRLAACPTCGGGLEPRFGAGHVPVAARCRRCGTEIS